ncbi:hypothetical protein [Aquicoccus sp.]|uniref:hypothetical protein n=1 Tax=Aquicoccus sp. TaxID=2055851 RepID=UPI0035691E27
MSGRDHLSPDARAAHDAMLTAWDTLTQDILRREGPAMEATARAEGKSATEAAQAAQDHVNGDADRDDPRTRPA